ncbi:vWA domain-containing protein [Clostridium fallax]|uniref:Predicted metal-dependent peptidase n=1 Tax=Clostridium fallax TaxID=1533 RepID=A0A1M4SVU7_9CLOT|nr:VWA-like domain-containing protein [Clostridium fallax]SHE36296.1 Predicted metal-dependent peptidase [Clostridium fallax]SQB07996.1 metal-dependent peptidase [Clostridium fallax]
MSFEDDRKNLLKEALTWQKENDITEDYKRKFFNLIEKVIVNMLEKDEEFFGSFMIQVKRDIKLNITWPIVTIINIEGFRMSFNPLIFLECNRKEMEGLLKHEIYHIILGHYEREKALKMKYPSMAVNIAMDIVVNQYIKVLPSWCKRLDGVSREFNIDLKADMTLEKYTEEISYGLKKKEVKDIKDKNSIVKEIDYDNCHEMWESENISLESLKEIKKKAAFNAYKGKAPNVIDNILKDLSDRPQIKWNEYLKRLIPSVRNGYRRTITRRDRRQPNRLELMGKLPLTVSNIIVAIDISASMSDDEFNKIMIEIVAICKQKEAKISVIECDNEIRRVYKLKSIKDIKPRSKKNGATEFTPVFKYINENNLKNNILVYFTDGLGEKELPIRPINKRILWVLTDDNNELSLKNPYGEVKRLERIKKENYGNTYGLEAIRQAIHDWAR